MLIALLFLTSLVLTGCSTDDNAETLDKTEENTEALGDTYELTQEQIKEITDKIESRMSPLGLDWFCF